MNPPSLLPDLVGSIAAIGRSLQEEFDPLRFLHRFAERVRSVLPVDRMTLMSLSDDERTATVFAEQNFVGEPIAAGYTSENDRRLRYLVADMSIRSVFQGHAMLVDDASTDPRFAKASAPERLVIDAGFRSALIVPLKSGGRIVGSMNVNTKAERSYTEVHMEFAHRITELIAPFIENVMLLMRERERRRRLDSLLELRTVLGASLDAREVFTKLTKFVRPVIDYDVMSVMLISESGRDLVPFEAVDADAEKPDVERMPLESYSFAGRVQSGEVLIFRDLSRELDAKLPGDKFILDSRGCSSVIVPLRFGDRIGGALYIGRRIPNWFDELDADIGERLAFAVVLTIEHQRLAEEQKRHAHTSIKATRLEERVRRMHDELGARYSFDRIIGRSPLLKETLARAARVAPTDSTVLITGESGTGKELVARAIHYASARAEGPFVAINCAALPDTLLESELFGHEKGAFTGADRQKPGRFELAAGGTLFLDEVGELSPAVQAKLLRVLQEHEFQRLGGTATLRADVRLIAATNRDLEASVAAGRFRDDLYYRLNVFAVHMPALRDRSDDVLLLADHFIRELESKMGKHVPGLSREARDALIAYEWPGNLRELQNAIEHALILSDGELITTQQLGIDLSKRARRATPAKEREHAEAIVPAAAPATAESTSLSAVERKLVTEALLKARGNKSRAAAILGVSRSQLYTRLKNLGIER